MAKDSLVTRLRQTIQRGLSHFRSTTDSPSSKSNSSATSYWASPSDIRDRDFFCKDTLLVKHEWSAIRNVIKERWSGALWHPEFKVLDVGCGNLNGTKQGLQDITTDIIGVDAHPLGGAERCDARNIKDYFGSRRFDVVMCKRVLCNIKDPDEQLEVVRQMQHLTIPGGITLICEPDTEAYNRLNLARADAGLDPLVRPSHNFPVATARVRAEGLDRTSVVAPGYVLWTRLWLPLITGSNPSYDLPMLRAAFPQVSEDTAQNFGVYRVLHGVKPQ